MKAIVSAGLLAPPLVLMAYGYAFGNGLVLFLAVFAVLVWAFGLDLARIAGRMRRAPYQLDHENAAAPLGDAAARPKEL